jgi:dipeptide/tripeptide permease
MTRDSDTSFFGHPRGLATLFFTEMWERFSYYGMRAILMLFMTASIANGGLGFGADKAGPIYAMYTSLVYLATVPGGWLADNFLGQRKSVFYGGVVIMIGHVLLALHGLTFFYAGLGCIVVGTGLLKPNISVIVGQLYTQEDRRRDAGFSIFYMGINLGAFAAPIVCGGMAQNEWFKSLIEGWGFDPVNSWHWGFAAAAVGMFFGLVQYVLTGRHLGEAGLHPSPTTPAVAAKNRRTLGIGIGATAALIVALGFIDSRATFLDVVRWKPYETGLLVSGTVKGDASTEITLHEGQAIEAGDMDHVLGQDAAGELRSTILKSEIVSGLSSGELTELFRWVDVPDPGAALPDDGSDPETMSVRLSSLTWTTNAGRLRVVGETVDSASVVLADLSPDEFGENNKDLDEALGDLKGEIVAEIVTGAIASNRTTGELEGQNVKLGGLNSTNIKEGFTVMLLLIVILFFGKLFFTGHWTRNERARLVTIFVLFCGAAIFWGIFEQAGSTLTLFADRSTNNSVFGLGFPSSWWQSVNAVMIVILAPIFAWMWISLGRRKRDPSYATKFAIGLFFVGLGFAVLVGGATLSKGGALVSPIWLLAVYFLHTTGELFLSPVGLSSMTKLAPARVVSLMMGVWFLAASVGNFLAGTVSGYYEAFELPTLFGVIAISGGVMALVMFVLAGPIKRMMEQSKEDGAA